MIKHVITNDVSLRDALQQMNDRRVKFLVIARGKLLREYTLVGPLCIP